MAKRMKTDETKEIHFFDDDSQFVKGRKFYLRHFPNLSKWNGKVITGEGSPDYVRILNVAKRVKDAFPNIRLLVTLREPSTRFESHWVGARDNKHDIGLVPCERAWNTSLFHFQVCLSSFSQEYCEKKLHENPIVRGIYAFQLEQWLTYFSSKQIFIIQAESMFRDLNSTMQRVAKFLNLRPYTEPELVSLKFAYEGSAHMSEPSVNQCKKFKPVMDTFYAKYNRRLIKLLENKFPEVLTNWVQGWSGI